MKKILLFALPIMMLLSMVACNRGTSPSDDSGKGTSGSDDAYFNDLIKAAKAEGELVIYGSCEDPYIAAAADAFQKKYGITTSWSRLTGGEVQAKIEEEAGNPSADVWFGGTSDPQAVCASKGLLMKYDAKNAVNLISDKYRDPDGYWYGIYTGVMGIFYNMEELDRLNLDYPQDWDDLTDPKYKGLIWFSNPNTASTAKLFLNATTQMWGEEKAQEYWVALDKNVYQYTKSGGGPSKSVGIGECVIGIGFLHDAVYQISLGYDNVGMAIPASGTAAEVGAVSIFEGCKHPNAAKLFIEFALTPECVELADDTGSFQFLVLENAKQPEILQNFDLSLESCIDYDFKDAKANTVARVEKFFEVIGDNADDRFKTE
jgi:iron(III) transport system substrate-binding protein